MLEMLLEGTTMPRGPDAFEVLTDWLEVTIRIPSPQPTKHKVDTLPPNVPLKIS